MERFPTWQVWRLIHTYPARDVHFMLLVLRVKPHAKTLAETHNAWTWIVVNLIVSVFIRRVLPTDRLSIDVILWINLLAVSLLITWDSWRFAWKVASAIAKAHEQEHYDLLVLPSGELETALKFCRSQRAYLEGGIRGVQLLVVAIALAGSCYLLSFGGADPYSVGFGAIVALLGLWIFVTGLLRCVDYGQAFVSATLIALLASRHQNRAETQSWVVVGFLGLQIALYVGLYPLLSSLPFLWLGSEVLRPPNDLYFGWLVVLVPMIFIICRELINFILWQAVKHRLQD